jgi:hypothetical protein
MHQGDMLLNKRPMTESLLKASSQYCTHDVLLYEAMTVMMNVHVMIFMFGQT